MKKVKEALSASTAAVMCLVFLLGTIPLTGCASGAPANQAAAAGQGGGFVAAPPPPARFTGEGGSGTRIAIMPLEGRGLQEGQEYLPSLVQGELLSNFRNNSAMSVLDRAGLPAVLMEIESGIYSPSADFGRLGEIAGADYFLMGDITATATGHALQLRVVGAGRETVGVTRASFSGTPTVVEMANFTGIRRASADLLTQMGVTLTNVAMQDLTRVATENEIRAETALARSIAAQDRGNEIEALLHSFQAAAFNPDLVEARNQQNVLTASIQAGNIGANVLQEIAWRAAWAERLTETERFFDDFRRENSIPYTLFYTTDIQQGQINWANQTVNLSITTHLHGSDIWAASMEHVLGTVQEGLRTTERAQPWGFGNWPWQGTVTGINAGARRTNNFAVVFELVNAHGAVIGRQTLQTSGAWQLTQQGIHVDASDRRTLTFQNVDANAITDGNMSVRVVSVNGMNAETAASDGVLQIRTITQDEINRNDQFVFARNTIQGFANNTAMAANTPELVIPAAIWDEPVLAIGEGAFDGRRWGNNRLTSVTIPNSVTTIHASAFRSNHLTEITIPDNVRSIAEHAFWDDRGDPVFRGTLNAYPNVREINITIGANVTMAGNSFQFGTYHRVLRQSDNQWVDVFLGFNGFTTNYAESDRRAGRYTFMWGSARHMWIGGYGETIEDLRRQERRTRVGDTFFWLGVAGGLAGLVLLVSAINALTDDN